MSTKNESIKTPSSYIILFFVVAAVILLIIGGISTCKRHSNHSNKNTAISYETEKNIVHIYGPKDIILFLTNNNDIFRIHIPSGYKLNLYGGGKKYYHQAQNSPLEIWGGGSCPSGKGNPNASFADIFYYNEEVSVRCEFVEIN